MQLSSSKTIAKNTFLLYLRMALSMIVSLYTVRAVINILGVEDYGLYNAIGGIVTTLSFLTAVLANGSQRFFAIEIGKSTDGNINKYFNAILLAYLIICIVVLLFVEGIGTYLLNNTMTIPEGRIRACNWVLHISMLTFVISLLGTPFYAIIIAYEKMNIYAIVSIFESFAKLGVVYLLLDSPFDSLVYYAILLMSVILLANLVYVFCANKLVTIKYTLNVDKSILKKLFSYSSWTLFGTVSGVAGSQGVSIFLNIFSGPVANAAFAISNQISATLQMFSSSFFTAVRPPLTKSYSANDFNYMNTLFNFSNKAIFSMTFAIVLPLLAKTNFVLQLWLGDVSMYMVEFVRIMLIDAMLLSLSNPITTIVQAAGKVKLYHSVVDGFALLVLPILFVYLKLGFEVKYSIAISVVVFGFAHVLRLFVLRRVISFSIRKYVSGFALPAAFVCILSASVCKASSLLIQDTIVNNLIVMSTASLVSLLLSFILLLNKEEKQILFRVFKKK